MNKRSGQDTKNKIVEAARRVFAEHGYAQANMRLIARSAETSVGGLYLYFKNKEDLCLTLMKESLDGYNRETREALQGIQDPAEALTCFISFSINSAKNWKEKILFQDREQGFSFGMELKKKFFRERREMLETIIREGIKQGAFRECDVTETAKIVFNVLRGFFVSLLIDNEALFSAEKCIDVFLYGLLRERTKI